MVGNKDNINIWLTQINNDFKAAVSVDCVIFGYDNEALKVLLTPCDMPPFEHELSLLGDLVRPNETTDDAAKRVLLTKTGLNDVFLDQVYVFSDQNRHPLGRVITVAYYSLIKIDDKQIAHMDRVEGLRWQEVNKIQSLAFDHHKIMTTCLSKMQKQIRERPIGFHLLPEKFTLLQLQRLYELVLDIELDKRNFRRKLSNLNILMDLGEIEEDVAHRPAKLYSFDKQVYDKKIKSGFNFGL